MTSSNHFNSSNQTPTLKVVPPTALKSTQPSVQPTPEVIPNSANKSSQPIPEIPPNVTGVSTFSVLRPLLIIGAIVGIGALGLIPVSQNVSGNAETKSTPAGRQTITMPASGRLELAVESHQSVKVGQQLGIIKSEEVKKDIAENTRINDQFQADANLSNWEIIKAESNLNEALARYAVSQQKTAFVQQQLAQGNLLPQIRELQEQQDGAKNEIIILESQLHDLDERQASYQPGVKAGAISKNSIKDLKREQNSLRQQIEYKKSIISSKVAQIDAVRQNLQQDLSQKQAEESQAAATVKSAKQQIEQAKANVAIKQKLAHQRAIEVSKTQERTQDLKLIATVNGIIETPDLDKKNHQYFQAGSTILEIVNLTKPRLEIQIKQEDRPLVEKGQTVIFRPQGRGLVSYAGTIEKISPTPLSDAVQRPSMFTVYVKFNSAADNYLLPGTPGHAHIEVESVLLYQKVQRELEKLIEIGKFF